MATHNPVMPQPTATPDIPSAPEGHIPQTIITPLDSLTLSDPPSPPAIQLIIPLPRSVSTKIHLHLTIHPNSLLLFTTTKSAHEPATRPNELGSFVIAIPDRHNPTKALPHSTPLYIREQTLETTTRIAKILARRLSRPVYVGNSMDFSSTGLGGSVEEVMVGTRRVVEVVVKEVEKVEKVEGTKEEVLVKS